MVLKVPMLLVLKVPKSFLCSISRKPDEIDTFIILNDVWIAMSLRIVTMAGYSN